jgi:hypothetical protein
MTMRAGQQYHCQNPSCRCQVEVKKTSAEAQANPKCCCGAEMKTEYTHRGVDSRSISESRQDAKKLAAP